jgi:uncharacterized protein
MKFPEVKPFFFLVFSLFLLAPSAVAAQDKLPAYKGHINDFAGILSAGDIDGIERKLLSYEDSTSTQIAVVIESGLNGSTPYDRAMQFARGWGVGSKEKKNGVLLYLAISDEQQERGYFTVTSQATQGKLTDGIVGQIQRDYLVPNLKAKNYAVAIDQTVTAYMQALAGEFVAGKKGKDRVPGWVFFLVVFGIISLISIINNNRPGRGYRSGGMYWFPTGGWGGNSGGWGGGSSGGGGGWGGFGGGGGFDGGGAGGSW